MKTALLIIDIQNDYFDGGKNPLVGSLEASKKAANILNYFRKTEQAVIHIQHLALNPQATFFVKDTPGATIHENVKPHNNETLIIKHYPNSFRETELLTTLQKLEVTELVICGMMTHMCVDATVRAAKDLGFNCTVIADACASRDLTILNKTVAAEEVHHSFLAALNSTYAKILLTNKFLSEV